MSLFFALLVSYPSGGQFEYEVLSDWEEKRSSEDITFSYRDVRVGDTLETKEMRMVFSINANRDAILPYFKDPDMFMAWSPDVDECRLTGDSGDVWTLYKYYDMPWPISARDILTKCYVTKTDTLTHLKIIGIDGNVPERDDVKRIRMYEGQWMMRPGNETTHIEFRTVQLDKPVGPRGIQNRVVENSFIKSVGLLQKLASGS